MSDLTRRKMEDLISSVVRNQENENEWLIKYKFKWIWLFMFVQTVLIVTTLGLAGRVLDISRSFQTAVKQGRDTVESINTDALAATDKGKEDISTINAGVNDMQRLGVRLVDNAGSSTNGGILEILHDGKWGTVCRDPPYYFSVTEAGVVCRMLGYEGGSSAYGYQCTSTYGLPTRPFWVEGFDCSGNEMTIYHCRHFEWGEISDCSLNDDYVCITCT